jgi:hypothetical protein
VVLRSAGGQRKAGGERGHIWLVGQRAVRQTLGAPQSEGGEGFGVVTGRVGDRLDRGYGGIGEELGGRVPAGRGAFGGLGGEDRGLVWLAGGERPPGQARQYPGRAGRKVYVPVVTACGVEQGPGPRQVTEAADPVAVRRPA